jgi:nitrogen-specific signal transduction histidine kinase
MDKLPENNQDSIRKIIHDLNGELFLIRGNTELASEGMDPDCENRKHLDNIMERTDAINLLVQRLRAKQYEFEGHPK